MAVLPPRQRMSKRQLLAALPDPGSAGSTSYRRAREAPNVEAFPGGDDARDAILEIAAASETGSALFVQPARAMLVVPAFPVDISDDFSEIYAQPLIEILDRPRAYAVFLLRLGGFSVGFFRGEALIDSKTDQRFVKNRHKKGGQSQRRFERIREKQVDELFGKACETSRETLLAYETEIQHVFLGGDRHTMQAFRKECSYFDRFGDRLMSAVLHVPGDPRRAVLEAMPREVWSSDVWVVAPVAHPETPRSGA